MLIKSCRREPPDTPWPLKVAKSDPNAQSERWIWKSLSAAGPGGPECSHAGLPQIRTCAH